MRIALSLAAALTLALAALPASAASQKDSQDCEQMTKPGLKVSACTRILQSGGLTTELKASALHHRGVGFLLQSNFDRAIVEFNEALRIDPNFAFTYNGRAAAWHEKGELDRAIADYNEVIRLDPSLAAPYNN